MLKLIFSRQTLIAIMLAAAVSAGSTEGARSGEAEGQEGSGPQVDDAAFAQPKTSLGLGDRLKITFLELIEVSNAGGSRPWDGGTTAAMLQTFYQRMDLTGEYTVADDGTISLPRLGRFGVDGREQRDLQSDLIAAFVKTMGRKADVNITVVERLPVYVVGPVKSPGAYKHVSGMIVLHAVALAGGLDQGLGNTSQLIDSVRERERLRKAADELKRLLAHRARLDAERKEVTLIEAPSQLVAIAGREGAQLFLGAEIAGLQIEQARRQQQVNELASIVTAAKNELDALKSKMLQIDDQSKLRKERLGNLKNLMADGLTTQNGVLSIRSELSDIETRRQDCHLAIVLAEARLSQAEQARERQRLDNAASLAKAIAATDAAISDAQQALTSSETVGSLLDESNARLAWTRSSTTLRYEIVRRRQNGSSTTQVEETSSLQPGDVLKITVLTAAVRDTGAGARQQVGFKEKR